MMMKKTYDNGRPGRTLHKPYYRREWTRSDCFGREGVPTAFISARSGASPSSAAGSRTVLGRDTEEGEIHDKELLLLDQVRPSAPSSLFLASKKTKLRGRQTLFRPIPRLTRLRKGGKRCETWAITTCLPTKGITSPTKWNTMNAQDSRVTAG